jgi:hypothetical protein
MESVSVLLSGKDTVPQKRKCKLHISYGVFLEKLIIIQLVKKFRAFIKLGSSQCTQKAVTGSCIGPVEPSTHLHNPLL